jgi:hypothetical protein
MPWWRADRLFLDITEKHGHSAQPIQRKRIAQLEFGSLSGVR